MSQRARVLLLDDGELGRIRGMLRDLDVDLEQLRGEVSASDLLENPHDVIFASVRRSLAFEGELDLGNLPGKPVWIAAHGRGGTIFHFDPLPVGERQRLERIIAADPEIRFLSDGEQDEAVVPARARPHSA